MNTDRSTGVVSAETPRALFALLYLNKSVCSHSPPPPLCLAPKYTDMQSEFQGQETVVALVITLSLSKRTHVSTNANQRSQKGFIEIF